MCNNTLDDSWGDQEIATGSYKLIFRTNMNNNKWVKGKGFQIYSLCFETKCKSDCLSHFIVSSRSHKPAIFNETNLVSLNNDS